MRLDQHTQCSRRAALACRVVGQADYIDQIVSAWSRERPDLDLTPMRIIGRISRAAHILDRRLEDTFATLALHGGRFDVLAALRRAGPPYCLTPTALYNSLLISSGAITNRLDRLAADGLVERIASNGDRRSLLVKMTPKGLKKINEAISLHLRNEHNLISELTDNERATLVRILRKLLVELGDRPHDAEGLVAPPRAPSVR